MAKACRQCGETKSLTDFAKDRSRPDGLTYLCKACRNAVHRAAYGSQVAAGDGRKAIGHAKVQLLAWADRDAAWLEAA